MLDFDRAGAGEPLLLLHGIGTTRDDFSALMPRLAAEFDVLAVDLPAHGDSPPIDSVTDPAIGSVPTVAALTDVLEADLDAHGLHRVHILGNSLGGRLGIELARRGRARSVVALAPSGLAGPPERVYLGLLMGSARIITRSIRPFIGTLARSRAGRAALLAAFRARPWEASREEALGVREGFAQLGRLLADAAVGDPARRAVWARRDPLPGHDRPRFARFDRCAAGTAVRPPHPGVAVPAARRGGARAAVRRSRRDRPVGAPDGRRGIDADPLQLGRRDAHSSRPTGSGRRVTGGNQSPRNRREAVAAS